MPRSKVAEEPSTTFGRAVTESPRALPEVTLEKQHAMGIGFRVQGLGFAVI